jgi:DNA polymerase-3 subunit alpha
MQRLQAILSQHGGLDRVELLVQEASGDTMRMELPTTVDAHNMVMMAEVENLMGQEGHVAFA